MSHNQIDYGKQNDGWMTCDFTSFRTVFHSHQDHVRMIMKDCVQWKLVYGWTDSTSSGARIQNH